MAISVAHPYYYNEIISFTEPMRMTQSFDYPIDEQMDFRNSSIADEVCVYKVTIMLCRTFKVRCLDCLRF